MENYDYIIDAFTKDGNNVNEEIDNLNVGCITSKNNNFELDSEGNLTVKSITTTDGNNLIEPYPVGSIYLSVANTNPQTFFGGVWERIIDTFLLAAGNTYAAGTTGGAATVTLDTTQIPEHSHAFSGTTNESGNHAHTGHSKEHRVPTQNYSGSSDYVRNISSSYDHAGITVTDANGNHKHPFSGTTSPTGGTQPHNNMPPYLAVYMWKRIA